jgi:catechol 2,3-dioxygenase-like lactoylglutathione lyase family enzyme
VDNVVCALAGPGAAAKAGQEPRPPALLHHFDFYTEDLEATQHFYEATRHFYKDIAGLQLRVFLVEPVRPGQGSEQIGRAFFGPADGGTMAFMQHSQAAVQARWSAESTR